MGWWWTSELSRPVPRSFDKSVSPLGTPLPTDSSTPRSVTEPTQDRTPNREPEIELIAWLKEIESEYQEASRVHQSIEPKKAAPGSIASESLYPTSMSCRSAFDYAFFCQSFGGQFVNIYRYGTFRSCSNHWQDFWLCMRTNQWQKEDRERAIADHYRRKAIKYKQGPSSEDIWQMRLEPVKDAFSGDLESLEREITEWKEQHSGAKEPGAR